MDKIHPEEVNLIQVLNQQNTEHECHCIRASMNRTPDLPGMEAYALTTVLSGRHPPIDHQTGDVLVFFKCMLDIHLKNTNTSLVGFNKSISSNIIQYSSFSKHESKST